MELNLIIDIGNTFIKLAFFKGRELFETETFVVDDKNDIKVFISKYNFTNALISSVIETPDFIYSELKSLQKNVIEFNTNLNLPVNILYESHSTLGSDRLALACGAIFKYPNAPVLVIDAGSCITYDFVDENANYYGGAISPGIEMRYKALNHFTGKLPLIKTKEDQIEVIGNSTENSIRSGVQNGILFEISAAIKFYKKRYQNLKIILCGGDGIYLSNYLKNLTFAQSKFLLYSLNEILLFNA